MLIWISLNNRGTWFGDRIQDMNSNYLYLLRRDLGPNMWFTLENSHRLLRKRCALECLGGIFYSYLLGWFDLWGYLTPAFFWLIFFLDDLSVGESGYWKHPPALFCWSMVLNLLVFLLWKLALCVWCIFTSECNIPLVKCSFDKYKISIITLAKCRSIKIVPNILLLYS